MDDNEEIDEMNLLAYNNFLKTKIKLIIKQNQEKELQYDELLFEYERKFVELSNDKENLIRDYESLQSTYMQTKHSLDNLKKGFVKREDALKKESASYSKALRRLYFSNQMLRDEIKNICESLCNELLTVEEIVTISTQLSNDLNENIITSSYLLPASVNREEDKQVDSHVDRDIDGYLVTSVDSEVDGELHGQVDKLVYRQVNSEIDRQADREINELKKQLFDLSNEKSQLIFEKDFEIENLKNQLSNSLSIHQSNPLTNQLIMQSTSQPTDLLTNNLTNELTEELTIATNLTNELTTNVTNGPTIELTNDNNYETIIDSNSSITSQTNSEWDESIDNIDIDDIIEKIKIEKNNLEFNLLQLKLEHEKLDMKKNEIQNIVNTKSNSQTEIKLDGMIDYTLDRKLDRYIDNKIDIEIKPLDESIDITTDNI